MVSTNSFGSSAKDAPITPGVYLFLDHGRHLLYAGKAVNLRRRLLDHAGGRSGFSPGLWYRLVEEVADVRWIEFANERRALCLEADIIVAFSPSYNAAMADDAFMFLCVDIERGGSHSKVRFRIEQTPPSATWTFGAFPHLGKGKSSWRAKRTNVGYSALLRLIWVALAEAERRERIPSRLCGSSPPIAHDLTLPTEQLPQLRDFLSGRSARLLETLRSAIRDGDLPAPIRRPLEADLVAAIEFFELGPQALRKLRLRHHLPNEPITKEAFVEMISADLRAAIGTFVTYPRVDDRNAREQRRSRASRMRTVTR